MKKKRTKDENNLQKFKASLTIKNNKEKRKIMQN